MFDESQFLFSKESSCSDTTTDRITTHVPILRTSFTSNVLDTHVNEPQSVPVLSSQSSHTDSSMAMMNFGGSVLALTPVTEIAGSSPTLVFSTTIADPPHQVGNTHFMVTRAKAGIYKPKKFSVEIQDYKLRTIDEAFVTLEWKKVTQDEFDALICNRTWESVLCPRNEKLAITSGCLK